MFAFRTHSIFWGGESVLSAGLGNMFVEPEVEQEDAFSNFNHRTQDTPGTIRPAQCTQCCEKNMPLPILRYRMRSFRLRAQSPELFRSMFRGTCPLTIRICP